MGVYKQSLEDLLGAIGSGISPDFALDELASIQGAHQERVQARKAQQQAAAEAQASLLGSLVETASTGAQEGMTFGQVKPLLNSLTTGTALQGAPYRRLPGIAGLFTGAGTSTVNPAVDAEDAGAVSNLVYQKLQHRQGAGSPMDLGTIRQAVMGDIATRMPPSELSQLMPALDEIITETYKRAVSTPSSGYLDQLLPTTPPG